MSPVLKALMFVSSLGAGFMYLGWTVTELQGGGVAGVASGVNAERGETIFWDTGPVKGTCRNCHSIGSRGEMKRCPNLGESDLGPLIFERAAQRGKHRAGQTGKPYTATDYIVESIADPRAYVVEGYPSNLMPFVYRGQIDLTSEEVMSVIAYLQSLSGEPDLKAIQESMARYGQAILNKGAGGGPEETAPALFLPEPEFGVLFAEQVEEYKKMTPDQQRKFLDEKLDPYQKEDLAYGREHWFEEGKAVFRKTKCHTCHKIEGEVFEITKGEEGGVGPNLTGIGAIQSRQYILESIVNPNAVIVPPLDQHTADDGLSKMPDLTDQITTSELMKLTYYLSRLTGAESTEPPAER